MSPDILRSNIWINNPPATKWSFYFWPRMSGYWQAESTMRGATYCTGSCRSGDQEPGPALEALKLRPAADFYGFRWISSLPKKGASVHAVAILLRVCIYMGGWTRWPSELWRPPRLSSASEQQRGLSNLSCPIITDAL